MTWMYGVDDCSLSMLFQVKVPYIQVLLVSSILKLIYSRSLKIENTDINLTDKKKYKFISKRRIVSLMHSSVLRRIRLNFTAFCMVVFRVFIVVTVLYFQSFLQYCQNARLVHQSWYCMNFSSRNMMKLLCVFVVLLIFNILQ
jgi:hypothetical protein